MQSVCTFVLHCLPNMHAAGILQVSLTCAEHISHPSLPDAGPPACAKMSTVIPSASLEILISNRGRRPGGSIPKPLPPPDHPDDMYFDIRIPALDCVLCPHSFVHFITVLTFNILAPPLSLKFPHLALPEPDLPDKSTSTPASIAETLTKPEKHLEKLACMSFGKISLSLTDFVDGPRNGMDPSTLQSVSTSLLELQVFLPYCCVGIP